jgi:hypothetical protein
VRKSQRENRRNVACRISPVLSDQKRYSENEAESIA